MAITGAREQWREISKHRRLTRDLTVLQELTTYIASTHNIQSICDTVVDHLHSSFGYSFISIYIGLNNKKKAMEWMEKAFTWRYPAPFSIGVDPKYDSLRDEPRFQEMLKELKLN